MCNKNIFKNKKNILPNFLAISTPTSALRSEPIGYLSMRLLVQFLLKSNVILRGIVSICVIQYRRSLALRRISSELLFMGFNTLC